MELKPVYPVKINLLPSRYIVRRSSNWLRLFFIVTLLFFSFLCFFFYISLSLQSPSIQANIESFQLRLSNLQQKEKKAQVVQAQINVLEQRIETLQQLIQSEPDWLQIMYLLGECMPSDLHLDRANFDAASFSCQGQVYSIFSLAQFISSMDQYRYLFPQIELRSLTLDEFGKYSFELLVRLKIL